MIVIKVIPEHLYITRSSDNKFVLSPIKKHALKFEEPTNYDTEYIKINNPELFYYMSLVKSMDKKAELEDYDD